MRLGRVIKYDFPQVNKGPEEGGVFFCHIEHNDIIWQDKNGYFCPFSDEAEVIVRELKDLLKTGRVWVHDAEDDGPWTEVFSEDDVPEFSEEFSADGFDETWYMSPYMPEFYFKEVGS